jgi:hypothetical protein
MTGTPALLLNHSSWQYLMPVGILTHYEND